MENDAFARIWNESDSLSSVSISTGYTRAYCSCKAANLRNLGLTLRFFQRGPPAKRGGGRILRNYPERTRPEPMGLDREILSMRADIAILRGKLAVLLAQRATASAEVKPSYDGAAAVRRALAAGGKLT